MKIWQRNQIEGKERPDDDNESRAVDDKLKKWHEKCLIDNIRTLIMSAKFELNDKKSDKKRMRYRQIEKK